MLLTWNDSNGFFLHLFPIDWIMHTTIFGIAAMVHWLEQEKIPKISVLRGSILWPKHLRQIFNHGTKSLKCCWALTGCENKLTDSLIWYNPMMHCFIIECSTTNKTEMSINYLYVDKTSFNMNLYNGWIMNEWIIEWMNGWLTVNGWLSEWMDDSLNGLKIKWMNDCMN